MDFSNIHTISCLRIEKCNAIMRRKMGVGLKRNLRRTGNSRVVAVVQLTTATASSVEVQLMIQILCCTANDSFKQRTAVVQLTTASCCTANNNYKQLLNSYKQLLYS